MNNAIFYHAYLDDQLHWAAILTEQFHEIINSGLGSTLSTFDITLIGSLEHLELCDKLIRYYQPLLSTKIKINPLLKYYDDSKLSSMDDDPKKTGIVFFNENETLHRMWKYCDSLKHSENVLFLHNKGITHVERVLKTGHVDIYANVQAWRHLLSHFNIQRFRDCIRGLDNHDAVGCGLAVIPYKFFSGNIWWSRSDYIKTLPDPRNPIWWEPFEQKMISLFDTMKDKYIDGPLMSEEAKKSLREKGKLDRFPIRYSSEAWLCSNPAVKTLSLYDPTNLDFYSYLCLERDYLANTRTTGS